MTFDLACEALARILGRAAVLLMGAASIWAVFSVHAFLHGDDPYGVDAFVRSHAIAIAVTIGVAGWFALAVRDRLA